MAGTISAVRFYKAAKNTGTHIGSVWSDDRATTASATFTGESASGSRTVHSLPALAVTANTNSVISYYAPAGHLPRTPGTSTITRLRHPPEMAAPTAPRCTSPAASRPPRTALPLRRVLHLPRPDLRRGYYWVDAVLPVRFLGAGCFVGVAGKCGDGRSGVGEGRLRRSISR